MEPIDNPCMRVTAQLLQYRHEPSALQSIDNRLSSDINHHTIHSDRPTGFTCYMIVQYDYKQQVPYA